MTALRWSAALAASALAVLGAAEAQAQYDYTVYPGLGQTSRGSGLPRTTAGQEPQVAAYNPRPSPYLATAPAINPYLPCVPAVSPYSLSTQYAPAYTPYGYGYDPYYPGYDPYYYRHYLGPQGGALYGYGYALEGMASLTRANAQYWKDIQTAALQREGVRQEALNTARRGIEFEMWREGMRDTAPRMREREVATELATARRAASDTDILSGKALNALLLGIQSSRGSPGRLPSVALEPSLLRRINVGPDASGSAGVLKDGGKLSWPAVLLAAAFDEPRNRLSRNVEAAVQALKAGEAVRADTLKDIRADHKALVELLDDGHNDLSPTEQIEARRYLGQVLLGVRALADPKAASHFNGAWAARGSDAAGLVDHMTKEGLVFTPAAEGDQEAYRSVYQAVRAYEARLHTAQQER